MEKNLEKAIKDWVYASDDSKLIDEVWAKCLNDKKINLDRIMIEKESDCLDEDKLFADTIDETLAYINSLKKEGWTSIEQKWSGYEDNYFVACKTVLEDDDDYAKRIGRDILNEKVRIEVSRREEVDAKRKKIEALEDEIKKLRNS